MYQEQRLALANIRTFARRSGAVAQYEQLVAQVIAVAGCWGDLGLSRAERAALESEKGILLSQLRDLKVGT